MARKIVLTTDMSPKGFDELAKQLTQIQKNLESYQRKVLTLSLREIKKIARSNVVSRVGQTGYEPTGELADSFKTERLSKEVGVLLNIHDNAAAIEFGTGIPGATMAHPVSGEVGYSYGGKPYWIYTDQNGWWWTEGQQGKRFMYDALIDFKEKKMHDITIQAFNETMDKGIKK